MTYFSDFDHFPCVFGSLYVVVTTFIIINLCVIINGLLLSFQLGRLVQGLLLINFVENIIKSIFLCFLMQGFWTVAIASKSSTIKLCLPIIKNFIEILLPFLVFNPQFICWKKAPLPLSTCCINVIQVLFDHKIALLN